MKRLASPLGGEAKKLDGPENVRCLEQPEGAHEVNQGSVVVDGIDPIRQFGERVRSQTNKRAIQITLDNNDARLPITPPESIRSQVLNEPPPGEECVASYEAMDRCAGPLQQSIQQVRTEKARGTGQEHVHRM
jgi:hypothetical protein